MKDISNIFDTFLMIKFYLWKFFSKITDYIGF